MMTVRDMAAREAVARAALYRMNRGIWTSSGCGDVRRSLAAAERVMKRYDHCCGVDSVINNRPSVVDLMSFITRFHELRDLDVIIM